VHWVGGLGVSPGHWAHREPAPHGELAVVPTQVVSSRETGGSPPSAVWGRRRL
jgi:hypothetical protein